MKCSQVQQLISVSLDGELDEARERIVQAHLAECLACRRFAADLPRCAAALGQLPVPEVHPGFTGRVMASIPEDKTTRLRWRSWYETLHPASAGVGALALCCGVLLAIWMNDPSRPTDSEPLSPGQSLYVGCFDSLPDDSVGARYVALIRERGD